MSVKRCPNEHLGNRQAIGREIMISKRTFLIRVIQENDCPSVFHKVGGLDQFGRGTPNGGDVLTHVILHGPDQCLQIDAPFFDRRFGFVEASYGGDYSLVKCSKYSFVSIHFFSRLNFRLKGLFEEHAAPMSGFHKSPNFPPYQNQPS